MKNAFFKKAAGMMCMLMLSMGLLVGCGKDPASEKEFVDTMKAEGFSVVDQSSMIQDGQGFKLVYLAQPKSEADSGSGSDEEASLESEGIQKGGDQYQVEYYVFKDKAACEESFKDLEDELVASYKDASGYKTSDKSSKDSGYRSVDTDSVTYRVSHDKDRLVIAIAPADKKSEVDGILKKLGYGK